MSLVLADTYKKISESYDIIEQDPEPAGIKMGGVSNVVKASRLRDIQKSTLCNTRDYLYRTFGPMGSNTMILKGENKDSLLAEYSKDGLKVLKSISYSDPIESSILQQLVDITSHVEHEVGDGTTSAVIMSSYIFESLLKVQKKCSVAPYELIRCFKKCVTDIQKSIESKAKSIDLNDIYEICMISTNGNDEISKNISTIYKNYGFDCDISVGISNTTDNLIKLYDGLTVNEGYPDAAFANNSEKGTCELHNPRIYYFENPIDSFDSISIMEAIIKSNIYDKLEMDEAPIPTVITCPRLSNDMSGIVKEIRQFNYKANPEDRLPVLIITNLVASDEYIMDDISVLCGCKPIKKYIDPKVWEKEKAEGKAPTVDTVADNFYGTAEVVVADSRKTKFVNPAHKTDDDPVYKEMIGYLESELKNVQENNGTANELGKVKRQLKALKANMIDFLVGGISISDRDAAKDLVEDAVKNCRSAAENGVGRAANFEGLIASIEQLDVTGTEVENEVRKAIFKAYYDTAKILYGSIETDEAKVEELIQRSVNNGVPFNIYDIINGTNSGLAVKCSIETDSKIIESISKIVTIMVTSNQCLLQAPQLNIY